MGAARPSTVASTTDAGNRAVAAVLALALGAMALGAGKAVLASSATLNLAAPVASGAAAPGATSASPPRRVLFVVVDGLRADVAATLPALEELARRGARAELAAEPPTFSSAQYVAFLAGVPPRDSGVRTNVALPKVALDTLPDRLRAAGRTSQQVGDEVDWWSRLFRFDAADLVAPAALLAEAERRAGARPDLLVVHFGLIDVAAHRAGAASAAYLAAALRVDRQLAALVAAWDGTVVVVTDHGHVAAGGHGGEEAVVRRAWLVAAGPGVRPGAREAAARNVDVAPTLAALLGVPAPAAATGRTLVELLELPDGAAAALAAADRERIPRAEASARTGRRVLAAAERKGQLLRFGALAAAVALAAWVIARGGRSARAGLAFGGASLALAAAAYALVLGRLSFSAAPTTRDLAVRCGLLGGGAAAIALAAPLLRAARRRLRAPEACAFAFAAFVGASPAVAAAFGFAGVTAPRLTCEPGWVAVAPLVAYALFTPAAAACALVAALAAVRR